MRAAGCFIAPLLDPFGGIHVLVEPIIQWSPYLNGARNSTALSLARTSQGERVTERREMRKEREESRERNRQDREKERATIDLRVSRRKGVPS